MNFLEGYIIGDLFLNFKNLIKKKGIELKP